MKRSGIGRGTKTRIFRFECFSWKCRIEEKNVEVDGAGATVVPDVVIKERTCQVALVSIREL